MIGAMSTTPPILPPGQIAEEFRQRRNRQWIAAIPGILAILVVVFSLDHAESSLFGIDTNVLAMVGGAVVLAYLMFSIWNWRCPACDGYMGKAMNPTFCAKCGARLKPQD